MANNVYNTPYGFMKAVVVEMKKLSPILKGVSSTSHNIPIGNNNIHTIHVPGLGENNFYVILEHV